MSENALHTQMVKFFLGDTPVYLGIEYSGNKNGLVFFHPHDDEVTSLDVTREFIRQNGGCLYSLKNHQKRLVTFTIGDTQYEIDPNRIFTRRGIEATLKKYGHYSDEAADATERFSYWLFGQLASSMIVATHNNRNAGYNIHSYGTIEHPVSYVRELYINPDRGSGEFFYTTNWSTFEFSRWADYNCVLQGNDLEDDGSLSVAAAKRGIPYVNIESERGHTVQQREMLNFIGRLYSNRVDHGIDNSPWPFLKEGDVIDLVDTSSAYQPQVLKAIQKVFEPYGLVVRDQFAKQQEDDLGYSNTDEERARQLLAALNAPDSQAVWAIRGGAGASRVLPRLMAATPPETIKPVIGFSDVTDVHLFLNIIWNRSTIHGVEAGYNFETDPIVDVVINHCESIKSVIDILMGNMSNEQIEYRGLTPLNKPASNLSLPLSAPLMGGNMTLISNLTNSPFMAWTKPYILILEDIGISAHQLERFLDGFRYNGSFQNTQAVILGQFLRSAKEQTDHLQLVLERFASQTSVPVFHWPCFGHGKYNHPLPLNTQATIQPSSSDFSLFVNTRQGTRRQQNSKAD